MAEDRVVFYSRYFIEYIEVFQNTTQWSSMEEDPVVFYKKDHKVYKRPSPCVLLRKKTLRPSIENLEVFHRRRLGGLPWMKILLSFMEKNLQKITLWSSMEEEHIIFYRRIPCGLLWRKTLRSSIKDLVNFCGFLWKGILWSSIEDHMSIEENLVDFYRRRPCSFYRRRPCGLLQKNTWWSSVEEDLVVF